MNSRRNKIVNYLFRLGDDVKIGVVSDTHFENIEEGVSFFARLFSTVFAEVDLLLHAGDIVHPDLLDCLTDIPILAVRGNCDSAELPNQRVVSSAGFKIGLMHGWGGQTDLEARICQSFAVGSVDAIVYGHSHTPVIHRNNGVLIMNPGSPCDKRQAPFHSVGMLTVGRKLTGKIINLDALWR
jgi:putative phosphoesterase